jgi:hypothetical protein
MGLWKSQGGKRTNWVISNNSTRLCMRAGRKSSSPGMSSYSLHTDHVSIWLDSVRKSTLLLCMRAGRKSNSPGKELPLSINRPTSGAHRVSQGKSKRKAGVQSCCLCNHLSDVKELGLEGELGGSSIQISLHYPSLFESLSNIGLSFCFLCN